MILSSIISYYTTNMLFKILIEFRREKKKIKVHMTGVHPSIC